MKKISIVLFCIIIIPFLFSCSNEDKKTSERKKENLEGIIGTPQQQEEIQKHLKGHFKPSEKKVW